MPLGEEGGDFGLLRGHFGHQPVGLLHGFCGHARAMKAVTFSWNLCAADCSASASSSENVITPAVEEAAPDASAVDERMVARWLHSLARKSRRRRQLPGLLSKACSSVE